MWQKDRKFVIVILSFAIPFLMATGIDLYAPSLPWITHYFSTTTNMIKLTVGFYLLGYGCSPIFFGILSDSYGRRKILLIALFGFFSAAMLAIFAPNVYVFLVMRLIQGMAIGGVGLTVNTLITDSFKGVALAKMASYMTVSWALGQITGPFIGGHLQQFFGWKASFVYFAIYGLAIFIITFFLLPETNCNMQPFKISQILNNYSKIISHRLFISGVLIMMLLQATSTIFSTLAPFLIQTTMKYSPVTYGYIGLFMGLAYFLGGLSNRVLINFIRPLRVAFIGLIAAAIASIIMIVLSVFKGVVLFAVIIPAALLFYFNGMVFPNCLGECLGAFPENAGAASAVLETFFGVGTFLTSVVATLLKSNTQLPIAVAFACIITLGLIIYSNKFKLARAK